MQTSYPGVTIRFVGRAGGITLAPGRTLLEAAREAGVEVNATCGGRGRCRGCRIKLTAGTPPPPTPADRVQLGTDEIREGYRLACQYRVDVDATVQIAPPAAESAFQIMTATGADQDPQRLVLDSGVRKHYVPAGPVAGEQRTSALEALSRRIGFRETPGIDLKTLRRLPAALGKATGGVTVTTLGKRIATLEPGDTRGPGAVHACDAPGLPVPGPVRGAAGPSRSGIDPAAAGRRIRRRGHRRDGACYSHRQPPGTLCGSGYRHQHRGGHGPSRATLHRPGRPWRGGRSTPAWEPNWPCYRSANAGVLTIWPGVSSIFRWPNTRTSSASISIHWPTRPAPGRLPRMEKIRCKAHTLRTE